MEIKKETTITPLTTDGEPLQKGDSVVMIVEEKAIVGKYAGMTLRGAVSFTASIADEKVSFNLMPSSIRCIYKADLVIQRFGEKE